jgi:hypothetical protein
MIIIQYYVLQKSYSFLDKLPCIARWLLHENWSSLVFLWLSHEILGLLIKSKTRGCCHGRNRMLVGFTTTYAISAYYHWCCEFDSRPGRGVQHYAIMFVSDLRQVSGFLRVLRFHPPKQKWPARYNWNIVESGVKHHQTNQTDYLMGN